jgi:hypothetical protein
MVPISRGALASWFGLEIQQLDPGYVPAVSQTALTQLVD